MHFVTFEPIAQTFIILQTYCAHCVPFSLKKSNLKSFYFLTIIIQKCSYHLDFIEIIEFEFTLMNV